MTKPDPFPDPGPPPRLRVRPYTMTRGRTSAEVDITIETMVVTVAAPAGAAAGIGESAAILGLCAEPLSVAEISAHLRLPLQVAKVLVGDLLVSGSLSSHQGAAKPDDRPDLALLERVLEGLQNL